MIRGLDWGICDFFVCMVSHVRLFATPWTNPPGSSVHGVFRQEYCNGLLFPIPWDLPDPGIEHMSSESPASPALAGRFYTIEPSGKPWRLRSFR